PPSLQQPTQQVRRKHPPHLPHGIHHPSNGPGILSSQVNASSPANRKDQISPPKTKSQKENIQNVARRKSGQSKKQGRREQTRDRGNPPAPPQAVPPDQ